MLKISSTLKRLLPFLSHILPLKPQDVVPACQFQVVVFSTECVHGGDEGRMGHIV